MAIPPDTDRPPPAFLGLIDSDVRVLIVAGTVLLIAITISSGRLSDWGRHAIEIERMESVSPEYRIDVNRAHWVELIQLEGIGETLARRIVEERETGGPFRTADDLKRVRGIGPATVEKIRPHVRMPAKSDEFGGLNKR
ncbi:ComEA family DNA-binding protein [Stratiformator vulcanicus]|uniref:ComEA family DNA-binding protein n=1 Tax=Stratiformator vulcanicus TaxID=2527980 RepID=UPI002877A35F|nr:helix-hairpin-helix domain-containing protein [Stratiformator vulcanicus]